MISKVKGKTEISLNLADVFQWLFFNPSHHSIFLICSCGPPDQATRHPFAVSGGYPFTED